MNRTTLSAQAAASIRKAIGQGRWSEYLPSERQLCEHFQVSRPTIRTALQVLAREDLIEIRHGRRNRLLQTPPRSALAQNRLVGLVTPEPTAHLSPTAHLIISELRTHLAENGFATEIFVCPSGGLRARLRAVETFVRQNCVFCGVLISATREVQQWFAQRSFPALVIGSCHQGVKLPSLDVDHRSICRHATGIFLGKGHRNIALVVHKSGFAGDLASEQGFCEGIDQHPGPDRAHATVVRHDGSALNITAQLDALFKSDHAPTALLVSRRSWAVFTYGRKGRLDCL
ncbi:MAG: GntR family transcriptional regulator [Verrucomicrobia bacterium]|nr:GntR family transcriptional regulator [Verrucomicrobiota bacterium]